MFSRKQVIKLLAPLIAEQIMAVLVGMVDVMMVAAAGESAVSGVSLVDSISVLIIQIMGALATGGAVISAQYLGKEQPRDARKAAGQLVLVTMLLSLVEVLILIHPCVNHTSRHELILISMGYSHDRFHFRTKWRKV